MATNSEGLLLSAVLESKIIHWLTLFSDVDCSCHLGIELTWEVGSGEKGVRSHFFAHVYVANNKVAKSNLEPRSATIKWEWNPGKKLYAILLLLIIVGQYFQISWFAPSSTMRVELYRGFNSKKARQFKVLNEHIGKYEGKIVDVLGNSEYLSLYKYYTCIIQNFLIRCCLEIDEQIWWSGSCQTENHLVSDIWTCWQC